MTVPATTRRAGPFLGNGSATAYPFTFKVFAAEDVRVVSATADGTETALTLGSGYTVTLNPDQDATPGGTVTATVAIGSTLTIAGGEPYSQDLDLPSGGNFSPLALENQLDKLVFQIQQVAEAAGRALSLPLSGAAADGQLPVPLAGNVIGWDETATGLRNFSPEVFASVVAYANRRTLVADGGLASYTLAADPGNASNTMVAVSGVVQTPGVDYTVSGVTLTPTPVWSAGTGNVTIVYGEALPVGTADAANVNFNQAVAGSKATTVGKRLQATYDVVADFGAFGDGVTDDTSAIQAAFNLMVNFASPGKLVFPRTAARVYRVTSPIVVPAGFAYNTIDFQGCEIRYDGPVSSAAAVFSMTGNQVYFNSFENGVISANSKAGYCVYAVGTGWQFAIKANKFVNCELRYPTAVCVQIGDQTGTGNDQDGADWLFLKCYFRAITPALSGAILDGDNVFNTNFSHCFFNTDSGTTSAGHLRVLRAGSTYVFDAFFGNLDPAAYCIDHRSGILGVFGANSEEGSILRTADMVEERKSIVLSCVMVNESTASATPEYAVYAPVGQITMQSCTFGKAASWARKVYAGDSLHATNVYLGSDVAGDNFGTYELDYPDRCSIEGQHLSNVAVLNGNPCMHLWTGTAAGDPPVGYTLTGSGTVTLQRSTTGAVQGPYTARLVVGAGYATGSVIDGLQTVVPVAQTTKTGRRSLTVVARGSVTGLTGATTLKLRVNMVDATGAVVGSNVISMTPSGGLFAGMCSVAASDPSIVAIVAMVGVGTAAASATIYVDNLYVVQAEAFSVNGGAHYKSYVDAWTKYARPFDGMLEHVKAGRLVGGTPTAMNKIIWGAAAPTVGDHRAGDVVVNTGGSTGNPMGWQCTVTGTPGTWRPMANLA